MNVATFAEAAEVQCWITSCNVQLYTLLKVLYILVNKALMGCIGIP